MGWGGHKADMRAMARQLGGEVASGAISCPGPGHSRLDRSLRVFPDHQAPLGFRVTSMAGDDWRECQEHVCRLIGVEPWSRSAQANSASPCARPPKARAAHLDDRARSRVALSIWQATAPLQGTIGEAYLTRRIGEAIEWPSDLRFLNRCPRGEHRLPAIIALLRDIRTDEPRAIQRIFLKDDGTDRLRDASGKMTLGPAAGAVCKLSPCANVTRGLGICEGVEKSLALLSIGWAPIWCTSGTSGMSSFPVLAGIETLTIFADADQPGQKAAVACAQRWADGGSASRIVTPRVGGTDWSDAIAVVA
jgi:putative DNA primase/helicase